METGLAIMGAVLFSGFIIYDTQLVMKHISPEDYIIAVLNLYLDIINLFIFFNKIAFKYFKCFLSQWLNCLA